jgi:hypothetical protein
MMTRISLVLALGLAACTPNNAVVEDGQFMAYLAANTSQSLFEDNLKFDDAEIAFNIDCRELDDEANRLEAPIDNCENSFEEAWLDADGFRAIGGALDPWRGEGIITSEGDIQIGFHHRLPGGEDFRFAFVIDPNFQPQRCAEDADGATVVEDIYGNWLENWSADVDGGTMYYLTNGGFQFNPSDTGDIWTLPQEWRSGGAWGRFAAEDLTVRAGYYGSPGAYNDVAADEDATVEPGDLFFSEMDEGADPTTDRGHQRMISDVEDISEEVNDELAGIQAPLATRVHTNEWRTPDQSSAGLDSWVELHYSYVRFDEGSAFEKGETVSGEFQLLFDASESQTRVMVSGRFNVDKLRQDRWVTDDVQAAKVDENGTSLCGEPSDLDSDSDSDSDSAAE